MNTNFYPAKKKKKSNSNQQFNWFKGTFSYEEINFPESDS